MPTIHIDAYPYLSDLLGGYFHQDCYDAGATDQQIVEDFMKCSWEYRRLGLRADLLRFVHLHEGQLVDAVQEAFAPNVILGETETEVREWMLRVQRQLIDK